MNVKAVVAQLMRDDVALATLLDGGIYTDAELTPSMGPPSPFDEVGRMRPAALVRLETTATTGPADLFVNTTVLVFFYDSAGYERIHEAVERAWAVLDGRRLGNGAYQLQHADDVYDQYDDAILAFMHRSRYQVVRRKTPPA